MRIKHQQTRDFFMYSHCVDLISRLLVTSNWWRVEDDVECWMLDVECWMLDFGFLMEFSIQHLKFKILPWSQGFSAVVLTMEVRIF